MIRVVSELSQPTAVKPPARARPTWRTRYRQNRNRPPSHYYIIDPPDFGTRGEWKAIIADLKVHLVDDRGTPQLAVWLKSHADGSRHTLRAYERIGRRFVEALGRPIRRQP